MAKYAGSKEFRDKIEERKGTEWYNAAKKVGDLHDPHMSKENPGVARYSGAEIRAEMRHGRGDMTTEELTKKYEDMYARGEINLNGNAKEFLREKHGAVLERMKKGDDPKPDPGDDNPGTNPPPGSGGGGNNSPYQGGSTTGNQSPIINQNTNGAPAVGIGGDNNGNINASVDNSRYYGGSSRTFNYTGGNGESGIYDSPVSKATMGGFYDVDDSPAANQKFLDQYITSNFDRAKASEEYSNSTAPDPRKLAEGNRAFNPVMMQQRIDQAPLLDRDRATLQFNNLFGDQERWRENPIPWVMPEPPSPIESNADEIADDYADRIQDF